MGRGLFKCEPSKVLATAGNVGEMSSIPVCGGEIGSRSGVGRTTVWTVLVARLGDLLIGSGLTVFFF